MSTVQNERLRKAAMLVAALDRPAADALLSQMSEAEAARVRRAVLELGPFAPDEQDEVLAEFAAAAPAPARDSGVEWVPSSSAGEEYQAPLAPRATRPFQFLEAATAETLAPLLEREHPQTVALVLAHLPAERAAPVLTALPEGLQTAVVRRLAELDDAHPDMLREVERSLSARYQEQERRRKRRETSQQTLVDILSAARQLSLPAQPEPRIMAPPATAPVPSRTPWQMHELLLLDKQSLAEVLGACDEDVLALALAGADPATYALLTRALGAHELRWVEGRLGRLGPTRLTDLERAADHLLAIAARLEQRGALRRPAARPALAA
jgi:flagellar motor switch protein FliG